MNRKKLRFATVCSGIGAPEVAAPAGWECVFGADIESFPNAVRAWHWPAVPNFGDMTRFKDWPARCDCPIERGQGLVDFILDGVRLKFYACKKCGGIRIDVLIAGTPCQAFSVAGLRKGLADPRGNLTLVFLAIVERYRPGWVLWENVPGVHSSWSDEETFAPGERSRMEIEEAGRAALAAGLDIGTDFGVEEFEEVDQSNDFDCFLTGLEELGYGAQMCSLDAQYFGLAQRRERVFVVGCAGGRWQCAAAVLFERESLRGDPAPGREAGQGAAAQLAHGLGGSGTARPTAPTLSARTKGCGAVAFPQNLSATQRATTEELSPAMGSANPLAVCAPIDASFGRLQGCSHQDANNGHSHLVGEVSPMLRCQGCTDFWVVPEVLAHGQGNAERVSDGSPSLTCNHEAPICFQPRAYNRPGMGGHASDKSPTLTSNVEHAGDCAPCTVAQDDPADTLFSMAPMAVRRLTPRECERLQGFPDDFTAIAFKGKPAADGPRYKALGNSMAVPVMRWLMERIEMVNGLIEKAKG